MAADIAVIVGASGGVGSALLAASLADGRFDKVVALSRRPPVELADHPRPSWVRVDLWDK